MKKIILFIENFLLILVAISLSNAHESGVSGARKCVNEKCSGNVPFTIKYCSNNSEM